MRICRITLHLSWLFSSDPAAGGSSDWAYDGAGVQYAFALELRDTGTPMNLCMVYLSTNELYYVTQSTLNCR